MSVLDGVRSIFQRQSLARPEAPSRMETPQGYSWQPLGGKTVGDTDSYDNVFPYVNAIAQRFSTIIPYAVTQDLQRIDPAPTAVNALYAPNSDYSCREFLSFIASSILTQSHLDVLIWTLNNGTVQPGGTVTRDNIAGYTFLPQNSRQYNASRTDWEHQVTLNVDGIDSLLHFTRDETIALTYSHHPVDPTRGIAPAMTIRKWASVDDMIADYERGFFGNGAVPAGMMGIVSETGADFTKNRNRLEDTFRGAGNNNGVVYNWIPVDPATNKPSQTGKLVWVPFQQSNNTLDLETVDNVVNNRLANAHGVPDIIRGIDNGQTYANAEQAEKAFIENTLQPLCLTVWDKWQFELDRICGDIGYGITFDLNLPAQTDVEYQQAQTEQTKVESFLALVNAGATPMMAAHVLNLPDDYGALTVAPQTTAPTSSIVSELPQLSSGRAEHTQSFQLAASERKSYRKALTASKRMMRRICDYAQTLVAASGSRLGEISLEWVDASIDAYQDQIIDYAERTGEPLATAIQELAATEPVLQTLIDTLPNGIENIYKWEHLPDTVRKAYVERLNHVADHAVEGGLRSVRNILKTAQTEGWTRDAIEDELTKFVDGDRAALLARNELVNAQRLGSQYSAEAMGDDLHVILTKVWNTSHDGSVCDFCAHMDGTEIGLEDTYMAEGERITVGDTTYVNDFMDKTTCDGHPNCRCYATYVVRGVAR